MENNMSNIITIASEGTKKKKGSGTNAILTLMKELSDFQDKVATCIESQDIEDRREKLSAFHDKLDDIAEILLEMASEGIKSKRQLDVVEDEGDALEDVSVSSRPRASSIGRVQMINAPSIPTLPR
jgi:hypothetical protein